LWVILSHKLGVKTPSFNAGPSLTLAPIKEVKTGGSSNSYMLYFPNHLGTHVDAPKHVDDGGKAVSDYPFEAFVFNHPVILELPKGESELVTLDELKAHRDEIRKADLLLLRTRFQVFRHKEPAKYMSKNPGVSAEAATYLASEFPHLRALGFDFISLSAVQKREEGGKAHRALLSGRDFFIIEDMDLSEYPKRARRVLVVPFFVEGVDSAPCTVAAET
jgi:arylformamidase